jgi:hypothetical protein
MKCQLGKKCHRVGKYRRLITFDRTAQLEEVPQYGKMEALLLQAKCQSNMGHKIL